MALTNMIVEGIKQTDYFLDENGHPYSSKKRKDGYATPMTPTENNRGYMVISITNNGKSKTYDLHRIVAMTLVSFPKPDNVPQEIWDSADETLKAAVKIGRVVNHIDHDKTNYHPSNLEWVTSKGNRQAAIKFYAK